MLIQKLIKEESEKIKDMLQARAMDFDLDGLIRI